MTTTEYRQRWENASDAGWVRCQCAGPSRGRLQLHERASAPSTQPTASVEYILQRGRTLLLSEPGTSKTAIQLTAASWFAGAPTVSLRVRKTAGLPDTFDFGNQAHSTTYRQLGNGVKVGVVWHVLLREHVKRDADVLALRRHSA